MRVNSNPPGDGLQQWFPWAACDPVTGTVSVIYYSQDAGAPFTARAWVAFSRDGGATWSQWPLSNAPFTPQVMPPYDPKRGYAGDYIGIAALGGKAFAAWHDNRTGQYQAFFEKVDTKQTNPPPPPGCVPDCRGKLCGGSNGCGGTCCSASSNCIQVHLWHLHAAERLPQRLHQLAGGNDVLGGGPAGHL